ncbi:hypothetical protein V6N11_079636 [Hibiscus sabdariffa]|uniref:Uncharacterized protein n=1 Tax=Hibiscus sabdariffa TaxID=183260 RepID=A0ABR2RWH3_9ROSI
MERRVLRSKGMTSMSYGALPRQKYIHVYIEEKLGHLVDTNEDEIAWIDKDETVWFDADDNVDSTVRNAETVRSVETVRNDETVRNVENVRIDETVRTYETIGNETEFDDENSSEDDDYVVFDHEDSDSPLEDSENDLADSGDEVCDVHVGVCVGVGRDIPGFSTAVGENEEMDNESDSDGSGLLHSASHNKRSCKGVVGGNKPLPSNSSARKPQRKTRRVTNSNVPQQVSTQVSPVSTAYIPPTDRIPKLSVKRVAPSLQATSSSQHCPNTSQGSVTNVRWMPSQKTQSSVQSQSHQAEDPTSKRPSNSIYYDHWNLKVICSSLGGQQEELLHEDLLEAHTIEKNYKIFGICYRNYCTHKIVVLGCRLTMQSSTLPPFHTCKLVRGSLPLSL